MHSTVQPSKPSPGWPPHDTHLGLVAGMTPMSKLDWLLVALGVLAILACMAAAFYASRHPDPPPAP